MNENPDNLQRAEIKNNGEFVFICKNIPSRFAEGEEFVAVKRFPDEKEHKFMKRKALLFRGRMI